MVSLFTNGTMITPKVADHLAEYPPRYVEITLYGMTKHTYEKITRTPGSFKKCLRGIRLLLERKIKLELKTMVMTLNRQEVSAIREFAEGLGLRYRFDGLIHPRLDGSKKVLRYRLTPEELVELEAEDKRWLRAAAKRLPKTLGLRPTDNLYNCGGALGGGFQIDPSGQLGVCASLRLPNYDLRQGCFHQGWYSVLPRLTEIERSKYTACSRCPIVSLCWLCPASSFLETGDPEARVEYYCRIAHLRYKILTGKEVDEQWRKEPIEDQQLRLSV